MNDIDNRPRINQTPSTPTPDNRMFQEGPPPVMNSDYIPGFLKNNIGKNVRAEFIVGTNTSTDRVGKLVEVGVNYFVLQDLLTRSHTMCDLYSVKFVTIAP